MSIQELTAVVAPPDLPVHTGDAKEWRRIEAKLGVRFPKDYREFIGTYGSGKFADPGLDIWVLNAVAPDYERRFSDQCEGIRWQYEEGEIPFRVHPELPGLLPWGDDIDGNQLFWLTEGKPDQWPTIVREHGGERGVYEQFDMPMSAFLAKVFTRETSTTIWPVPPHFSEDGDLHFEPAAQQDAEVPSPSTVYALYEQNENQCGFWMRHIGWHESKYSYVKSIGGISSGALPGDPPEYGRPSVKADIYVNGQLVNPDRESKFGYQQVYIRVDPPSLLSSK